MNQSLVKHSVFKAYILSLATSPWVYPNRAHRISLMQVQAEIPRHFSNLVRVEMNLDGLSVYNIVTLICVCDRKISEFLLMSIRHRRKPSRSLLKIERLYPTFCLNAER